MSQSFFFFRVISYCCLRKRNIIYLMPRWIKLRIWKYMKARRNLLNVNGFLLRPIGDINHRFGRMSANIRLNPLYWWASVTSSSANSIGLFVLWNSRVTLNLCTSSSNTFVRWAGTNSKNYRKIPAALRVGVGMKLQHIGKKSYSALSWTCQPCPTCKLISSSQNLTTIIPPCHWLCRPLNAIADPIE